MLGLEKLRDKLVETLSGAQETVYKVILVLLTITALLWMSIFLYASFYYSYIPPVSHTRPVHLQFSRSCDRSSRAMCDFPSANITLTRREQFLMVGQPYKILLELEVPESPANRHLGMFMTCARLQTKDGDSVESSCRSALIQYKSTLLHMISTIVFYPLLFSGSYEEKQILSIELFSNFQEDRYNPVTDAFIEIQSYNIEIYQASLKIHAHFTGLRYLMFHWPLTSAVLGICTNLFFLSIIAFLSWVKFFKPTQRTVHVGYDTAMSRTVEVRHTAKERILSDQTLAGTTPLSSPKPVYAYNKEDLDPLTAEKNAAADESFDPDYTDDVPPKLVEDAAAEEEEDEDQVVPEGKFSGSSSSSEDSSERKTSSEFEVIENGGSEKEDENPILDGKGQGDVRRRKNSK